MDMKTPLGFTFAGVPCGLKKTGDPDLALIASDRPCAAAAVFTRNRFPAAPVLYDRALVAGNPAGLRAVAVNAGVANACTGDPGLADAAAMARAAEQALRLPARSCAVMSTGVIGPRLPMEGIAAGIRAAAAALAADGWDAASRAIMTTDTRPKIAFRRTGGCTLFGMAKGAGMIHPDMATMLSVVVTDAALEPDALGGMLREAVDASFNRISVDGDTSTNDTVLVLANGAAGKAGPVDPAAFAAALADLCTDLAQQIVRDGEGATKFITIRVRGAASDADARLAAKAVSNSPLVKTAFYGGDANWGRILAAVGYSGAAVDPARAGLWIAAGADADPAGVGAGLAPAHVPAREPARAPVGDNREGQAQEGQAQEGQAQEGQAQEGQAQEGQAQEGQAQEGQAQGLPLQLVGGGRPLDYSEAAAGAIFAGPEITVTVDLGLGAGRAIVWTCDLSHEYVSINGHYRT